MAATTTETICTTTNDGSDARKRTPTVIHQSQWGMFWCAGWMFTIGYAKLVWWKALLALVVWPYFLATAIR